MTGKTKIIGTRAQVWHGTCKKTSGGLTKSDLMMNKHGHIVSRAKHNTAKKEKRLLKAGYGTKKGKFGFVKIGSRKMRKSMKGGYSMGILEPADYSSTDITGQGASTMGFGTVASFGENTLGMGESGPLADALTHGGSRRSRGRGRGKGRGRGMSMRGGYNMSALEPADVTSMDITGQGASTMGFGTVASFGENTIGMGQSGPLTDALTHGGARRRRRGRKMRGGTSKQFAPQWSLTEQANNEG